MAEDYCLDGHSATSLARELDLPGVELLAETGSTLDVAHRLAAKGAPSGTLVIADRQTEGRGRQGRSWSSAAGAGLWLTLIERPRDQSGLGVLSIRVGLRAASALDRFSEKPVRLKWPNDLYVGNGKLGGVLIEARWRERELEWIALGVGINVTAPSDFVGASGLDPGTRRAEVLAGIVPAIRSAAAGVGDLTARELAEFNARDIAGGQRCSEPGRGIVRGISPSGELLVELADTIARFRSGSIVLEHLT